MLSLILISLTVVPMLSLMLISLTRAEPRAEPEIARAREEFRETQNQFCAAEQRLQLIEKQFSNAKSDLHNLTQIMKPLEKSRADLQRRVDIIADSLRSVRNTFKKVESIMECQICASAARVVIFDCGHGTCEDCSARIDECPFCRKMIEQRTKLFDA